LSAGTNEGILKVTQRAQERSKYHDLENIDLLDFLESSNLADYTGRVVWHRGCYGTFTNTEHTRRLKKRYEKNSAAESSHSKESEPQRSSRRSIKSVNWTLCMYCQEAKHEKLHDVSVLETSQRIIQLAQRDLPMRCRLVGVSDLVAAEGKYHLKCYTSFLRRYSRDAPHRLPMKI